jgi:hypothetical protein
MPPALTEQQRKFAKLVGQGVHQSSAARQMEYGAPAQAAWRMMKNPKIQLAVAKERERYAKASDMTRAKVIDGMKEAIDMARLKADPTAMIQGYREIGRMCGFYEPTKHQVNVSVNGQVMLQRMQSMSDAELLQLAEEKDILEGEFEDVTEDTDT